MVIFKYLSASPVVSCIFSGICHYQQYHPSALESLAKSPLILLTFACNFFLPVFSHPFLWHRFVVIFPPHNESRFSRIVPSGRDRFAAATCPLQPLILALKPSYYFIEPVCLSVAVPVAPLQHTTSICRVLNLLSPDPSRSCWWSHQLKWKNWCPKTTVSFHNPFPREHCPVSRIKRQVWSLLAVTQAWKLRYYLKILVWRKDHDRESWDCHVMLSLPSPFRSKAHCKLQKLVVTVANT